MKLALKGLDQIKKLKSCFIKWHQRSLIKLATNPRFPEVSFFSDETVYLKLNDFR